MTFKRSASSADLDLKLIVWKTKVPQGSDVGLEPLIQSLPATVEVKKAEIEIERSKAFLAIEKSKRVPDH